MRNSPSEPRLVLRGITKRYPAILANDHVDLRVEVGEIHGLMGEHGAGKSTLMKIVCGVTRPDALAPGRMMSSPATAAYGLGGDDGGDGGKSP